MNMETLWPMRAIATVFARPETAKVMSGLPAWHRILGGIAAVAFYSAHLWPVIGR
jgi:hypothetical protein